MEAIIDGFNFGEMEPMKYYCPPASWSDEKKKQNVQTKIFSNEWLGAEKKDGFFARFVKDDEGNMYLSPRSRNVKGEFVNKIDWVPQLMPFFKDLPNGTCLLGELYLPNQPGSKCVQTIMGCLQEKAIARQEKGEKICFYVFDCLAWAGKDIHGHSAMERFNQVMTINALVEFEYVGFAHYYYGENLWNKLQEYLADGKEGVVITFTEAKYEPGKRPSKTTLKVKQELRQTIDCVIIGANEPTKLYGGDHIEDWRYWRDSMNGEFIEGELYNDYFNGRAIEPVTKAYFYNWAGSLKLGLYKDGVMTYFGDLSGITDEVKANWRDYIGKVAEVGGMQIDNESGHIRHPRLISWRADKSTHDCDWSQLSE